MTAATSFGAIGFVVYRRRKNVSAPPPPQPPPGDFAEIRTLIDETASILAKAIDDALRADNPLWITALRFLKEDLDDISHRTEAASIGYADAKARTVDLRLRAEKLKNPPPASQGRAGPQQTRQGGTSVRDRAYGALGVDPNNADGYTILGVGRGAGKEEIDRAFKQKQLGWHPDKFPSPNDKDIANAVSTIINNARDQIYKERGWK